MTPPIFRLRPDGWIDGAQKRPSSHFNERPDGALVSLVVLHFISLPPGVFSGEDVDALFTGTLDCRRHPIYRELEGVRVSSHYVIRRSGLVRQYVGVHDRAWHAGVSVFEGRPGCNDYSVGIELEGTGEVPFEAAQYESLAALLRELCRSLPIEAVTGHEFIAPGRKNDPGPCFDWDAVRRAVPAAVRVVTVPQTACAAESAARV